MNKDVIIHIMIDEKFNDTAIRQFQQACLGRHEYLIISNTKRITKSSLAKICSKHELKSKISHPSVAGVIFHSLPKEFLNLLNIIPLEKCVVWIGWGYDYYDLISRKYISDLVLPSTKIIEKKFNFSKVKRLIRDGSDRIFQSNLIELNLINRIDYFAPVLDLEFEMVKESVGLRAEYICWNYGTAEEDLDFDLLGGVNILAGNSASATNNHVELFESIRDQVNLSGRKVIVPLSYGDDYYRKNILKLGEKFFGNAFHPLIEFMPIHDYHKIINSCEFFVMNHLRQQALGNICSGLLAGAKVYLNTKNPLMNWLEKRGVNIGNINNIDMISLDVYERKSNRSAMYSYWSSAEQHKKTLNMINKILNF